MGNVETTTVGSLSSSLNDNFKRVNYSASNLWLKIRRKRGLLGGEDIFHHEDFETFRIMTPELLPISQ
jgi:hypothetical protein